MGRSLDILFFWLTLCNNEDKLDNVHIIAYG